MHNLDYKIIAGLIPGSEDEQDIARANISVLKATITESIFKGCPGILYLLVMNAWKFGAFLTQEYVENNLKLNMPALLKRYKEEPWVKEAKRPGMTDADAIANAVIEMYNGCEAELMPAPDFKQSLDLYVTGERRKRAMSILFKAHQDLEHSVYSPEEFNAVLAKHDLELLKVKNMVVQGDGVGSGRIIINKANYGEKGGGGVPYVQLGKFAITEFDGNDELGGGYLPPGTGQIITVVGESKAGKTRLCMQFVHEAVLYGSDVGIGALELRPIQYKSMLIARHIAVTKNILNIHDAYIAMYLASKMDEAYDTRILDQKLTLEQRVTIDEAEFDLYNNPKYGQLNIFDCNINVEDLWEKMTMEYSYVPFKMLLVDYPALLGSSVSSMTKTSITSKAFIELKKIANSFMGHGLCVLAPNQMTEDGIKALKKGEKLDQSSSGDSREAIKSCDLALAVSKQGVKNTINERFVTTVATRFLTDIEPGTVYANLGCCLFMSQAV